MLLTNKDYTPISKSDDDHYVADRTVGDLSVLIRSLASFAVSKCIDFNDFAGGDMSINENSPRKWQKTHSQKPFLRINENSPRKWPKTHSQKLFLRINENSPRKWPKTHSQKLFLRIFEKD